MAIFVADKTFYLETLRTSYIFCIQDGFPVHLYYGARIERCDLTHLIDRQIYSFCPMEDDNKPQLDSVALEYSGGNTGDFRICGINIRDGYGRVGCRLQYAEHAVTDGVSVPESLPYSRAYGRCNTLTVTLRDQAKKLTVRLIYTVFEDSDVIARHTEIVNFGRECYLLKAASFLLDFLPRAEPFDLIEVYGTIGHEFSLSRSRLTQGMRSFGSNKGFTSHTSNPFFCLTDYNADEDKGEAYGFNLLYSGNFLCEVQFNEIGKTRIVSGVNAETFEWHLGRGESFTTPQAVLTYSASGIGQVSRNFHDHIRKGILPERFAYKPRPIVVNTWETCGVNVDEEKVLRLARRAKELGIDTVVLDDGWFRNDNRSGLGEWETDRKKFPSGLGQLSDTLHGMGLRFGLWIEPEMVSKDGLLMREHPDWIVGNGDTPYSWRYQYVLDFANPEIVDYIGDKMEHILREARPDFVKWDANRYVSESGSNFVKVQGEVPHRLILGLYRLLERLTNAFPEILFESCSGGGGRFDLGMLYYTPQIWLSDNTNPFYRKDIQRGVSFGYPPSSVSCHVTATGAASLGFRYLVSSFGTYGYEFDICALSECDAREVAAMNRRYRDEQTFVLEGDLYRLADERTYQAYEYVLPDKSEALLTFLLLEVRQGQEFIHLRLAGLDPKAKYRNTANRLVFTGETLMKAGFLISDLNVVHQTNEGRQLFFNELKESGGGVKIRFIRIN